MNEFNPGLSKELRAYIDEAHARRGKFINAMINLELLIDKYISDYFCPDKFKADQLKKLILYSPKTGLSEKLDILKIIMKNEKDFKNQYPNFFAELRTIIKHRNTFAHTMLDITKYQDIENDSKIEFYKHSNDKWIPFSKNEFQIWVDKITIYINAIYKLIYRQ